MYYKEFGVEAVKMVLEKGQDVGDVAKSPVLARPSWQDGLENIERRGNWS